MRRPWLPHGPEFRFVDEVLRWQSGCSVTGRLDLRASAPRPLYSGSLPCAYLLEAMIQTCGLLFPRSEGGSETSSPAVVVALDRVRWYGTPGAADRILTRCRLLSRVGALLRCRCAARREGGGLLATGDITLCAAGEAILESD